MLVAGIDLGSATGKAVVMEENKIVSAAVIQATTHPEKTARTVLKAALEKAGIELDAEVKYTVGTGYGRYNVSFVNENISEITCHARGAIWMHPKARTVVDVGGQDCKVISLDDAGRVVEFTMNDKCAAGTGKFFEAMARTLHCTLDEFSNLSLKSNNPANITKQCSVFAESEVVTLINSGADEVDIAAGLTDSIARRLQAYVYKVGLIEDVVLTGGCARNEGLVRSLERKLNVTIVRLPHSPQLVGALGAALFAGDRLLKGTAA
jgi:predicted CoA-substrate-specific enzyme activase